MTNRRCETINSSVSIKNEFASIFAALEKINHRLDRLEADTTMKLSADQLPHPSLEMFGIPNAAVDDLANEKTCAFEPEARPCDHCSMCSSRGF